MRTIEGEVIPRLVLAHRGHRDPSIDMRAAGSAISIGADHLEQLIRLLLVDAGERAHGYVDALVAEGAALDAIYLDLFAPAARRLGAMWTADECDFTAVTLGLWRLQRLLHEHTARFQADTELPLEGHRILLAPMPGEQHTFGLFMVAEFFRRGGWDVTDGPVLRADDLVEAVRTQWFDVIGLSLGGSRRLPDLAALVRDLRRSSRNRAIGIIVGGPVFLESPDAAVQVDADAYAVDARQALQSARDLLFSSSPQQRATGAR
ncbi:MAG: cobalamin B12-binding domain-containing protein [Burkholderiaceae bacterium]|nr:cobalamin B12-binding domain-containing protein [Burkholderiaceae bacterium]